MSNKNLVQISEMIHDMSGKNLIATLMLLAFNEPEKFVEAYNAITDSKVDFSPPPMVISYDGKTYDISKKLLSMLQEAANVNLKVAAIKEFRAATGAGLKQAKDCVEYLAQQGILKGSGFPLTWGDEYNLHYISHRTS